MHIYAFGSVCRGEIDVSSDIDMLAIVDGLDARFDSNDYSIYSYARLIELWQEGNSFAWHLYLEAILVHSSDNTDYLRGLGEPNKYKKGASDCKKFHEIFLCAKKSIEESSLTEIFDLSSVFLAIRNFATCYSLHSSAKPIFSRNSALCLGSDSLDINQDVYDIFERARILCTRGLGEILSHDEICKAKLSLEEIGSWMKINLATIEYKNYE